MRRRFKALIDVGEQEGIIEENEGVMIQSIIRFSDRTVGEVMTPRPNIVAIEATQSLAAVRDVMIESKYSRLPVYRDQIDNVEGIIYVRDLLQHWAEGGEDGPVSPLVRPVYFVPETKPVAELLEEMQKAHVQLSMVIDEYGGVCGLVTVEDILEEIVGEIEDEDEPESDRDQKRKSSTEVDGTLHRPTARSKSESSKDVWKSSSPTTTSQQSPVSSSMCLVICQNPGIYRFPRSEVRNSSKATSDTSVASVWGELLKRSLKPTEPAPRIASHATFIQMIDNEVRCYRAVQPEFSHSNYSNVTLPAKRRSTCT